MTDFSLICSAHNATSRGLKEMLDSLAAQTLQSYEVVLVVGSSHTKERLMVQALLPSYPNMRMVLRPNQETLASSATALLPTLQGAFIGFIGYRDKLLPETLQAALLAIAEHPNAKVVFTDEECRDALNRITQRFDKLGVNPMRLRAQEYLRDLALIDRTWLTTLGGFNPVTSEWPSHDIYLKTLETHGAEAFVHISERLYQRFRVYRDRPADLRRRSHIAGFDTQAVRHHLERLQLKAKVMDNHRGALEIVYDLPSSPFVQVFVILDHGLDKSWRTLQKVVSASDYAAVQYTAVCTHPDPIVASDLAYMARMFGVTVHHAPGNLPAFLNQEISRSNASYIALHRGERVSTYWLKQLLSHALLPGTGVVGGKCMTPLQLTLPGVLNYRYEGWDWNSRGKFDLLNTAHTTSAVSSNNMLFSLQHWVDCNGFNTMHPELFGMDFCFRVAEAGHQNIMIPSGFIIAETREVSEAETALFKGRWSAWSDPYKMILPW